MIKANISTCYLKNNKCYTNKIINKQKFLILHSVGCNQPNSGVFMSLWDNNISNQCPHAIIDGTTGEIINLLPWEYKGWHVGGLGNDFCVGVEMCEPKEITYTTGARFVCDDVEKAKISVKKTYQSAVTLFAYLCDKFGFNPYTTILSHSEGYKKGVATNHGDPEHLWTQLQTGYTMDGFRRDVNNLLNKKTVVYRVQIGAFTEKSNAEKMVKELKTKGYNPFITT